MEQLVISNLRLGIVGGGQLGKMLALAASNWDIKPIILDQSENTPAAFVSNEFVAGDFRNEEVVYQFGQNVDMLTIEIEQANIEGLERLQQEGKAIQPAPRILRIIQDKLTQNQFFQKHGFPKPEFYQFEDVNEIKQAIIDEQIKYPFVQKTRQFGYDGKGVHIVQNEKDINNLLDGPCITEEKIQIQKEISVLVARNGQGQVESFPVVDMEFNAQANLLEYLYVPSEISPEQENEAKEIAIGIITALDMQGILAVEMFIDQQNKIWVNEIAPRPHNSGHHTIESCMTSQYEQHLRAIFDLPLGSTRLITPALMMNILGEPGHSGIVRYEGLTKCMEIEGVKIHIYGKPETRPFRKMGHVTILDENLEKAKEKAKLVRKHLKVVS